jgi:hypothetical protein
VADDGVLDEGTETAALREVVAAEHAAVWGYGALGAALPTDAREAGYTLPFPVLSAVDAAALAVVLEEGVSAAWVRLLDQAAEPAVRELAVAELGAAEVRAVGWRAAAGRTPATSAFPGLPQ